MEKPLFEIPVTLVVGLCSLSERRILMMRKRVVVYGGGLEPNSFSVKKAARGNASHSIDQHTSLKKV